MTKSEIAQLAIDCHITGTEVEHGLRNAEARGWTEAQAVASIKDFAKTRGRMPNVVTLNTVKD